MKNIISCFLEILQTSNRDSETVTLDNFSLLNQFIILRSVLFYPFALEEYRENYGVLENVSNENKSKLLNLRKNFLPQFKQAVATYEECHETTGTEVNEIALITLNMTNINEILYSYPACLKSSFENHIKSLSADKYKALEYRYGPAALKAALELKNLIDKQ